MECYATCPAGLERLLAHELESLGVRRVRPLTGQVSFGETTRDAYRACLWLRMASRVVVVVGRGAAADADELYETVGAVAWEEHLLAQGTFAVDAHGTNAQLRNTRFVALRAKDAVTDRMLAKAGTRPATDTARPDLRLVVRLSRDRASVGVDLAGDPLFRRGYEAARGSARTVAPLRADYAAALLATGGWQRLCRARPCCALIPFSGAGTLAVEAASQALDRAPGLLRTRWGLEGWRGHDAGAWAQALEEARERAQDGGAVQLLLSDARGGCEAAARQALRAAGIDLEPTYSDTLDSLPEACVPSLVACDLSWLDEHALAMQTDALGRVSRAAELADGAPACVLATTTLTDRVLGAPDGEQRVIVGRGEASIRSYEAPRPTGGARVTLPGGQDVRVLVPASDQFARRLAKVWRQRRRWARREDVSCYRIYDADLPDYAVSIDLFEGSETPGRWLQVYEYAPPRGIDADLARSRLLDVVTIAPRLLDVRPEDTFVRVRTRARGGSQYADEGHGPEPGRRGRGRTEGTPLPPGAHLVDEGGLTFEVNFSGRLDCGLFLDHRDTRALLREMAKRMGGSGRFLNLFAYTGTGTCYAADGGARHTTTVDLSRPSLAWARRNMGRNGFTGPAHEFVQADVIAWVQEQRHGRNRWDLVFCDVPTFSNSSRMRGSSFDVQRDHVELLIGVSRLLARGGTCVFSCNLRSFRIDGQALAKAGVTVEDITDQTIPEDFSRNRRIHACYLVSRTPRP